MMSFIEVIFLKKEYNLTFLTLNFITMIAGLIGIIFLCWGLYCVYDLFTKKQGTDLVVKILVTLLILCTNFVGTLVYHFYLRDKLK